MIDNEKPPKTKIEEIAENKIETKSIKNRLTELQSVRLMSKKIAIKLSIKLCQLFLI